MDRYFKAHYYMAVTADKYELPIAVARTQKELCKMLGVDTSALCRSLKRGSKSRAKGIKEPFRVVIVEDIDEDERTMF